MLVFAIRFSFIFAFLVLIFYIVVPNLFGFKNKRLKQKQKEFDEEISFYEEKKRLMKSEEELKKLKKETRKSNI